MKLLWNEIVHNPYTKVYFYVKKCNIKHFTFNHTPVNQWSTWSALDGFLDQNSVLNNESLGSEIDRTFTLHDFFVHITDIIELCHEYNFAKDKLNYLGIKTN